MREIKGFIPFPRVLIPKRTSSSCRAASTDIPDPLSPLLPIVHRLWQVFRTTSRILTLLLYVCSSWSSCFCSAICGGPLEYITYELTSASLAVSCVSGSSNLDSFRDGEAGCRIVVALWGVAARTYSVLLVTFLYNSHLLSSSVVLLASKWCFRTAVSIRPPYWSSNSFTWRHQSSTLATAPHELYPPRFQSIIFHEK